VVHSKEKIVHVSGAGKASVLSTMLRLCVSVTRLVATVPTLFAFAVTGTCISAVQILTPALRRFVIEMFSTWVTDAESRSGHVMRELRVVATPTSSLGMSIIKTNTFFIGFSRQNNWKTRVARTASISSWRYKDCSICNLFLFG